jgi:hypothetical protein
VIKEIIIKMHLTVVTGFFDLASRNEEHRRGYTDYYPCIEKLLTANLGDHVSFVIFCDPQIAPDFRRFRSEFADRTLIVPRSLEELNNYRYFSRIVENNSRNRVKNMPIEFGPKHYVIEYEKMEMVKMAAKINPFRATHFAWCDAGICKYPYDKLAETFEIHAIPDKIKMLLMRCFSDAEITRQDYYEYRRGEISAGYFTGSRENMLWLAKKFKTEVKLALDAGYAVSEEMIFPKCIIQDRSRFTYYYGDYIETLINYNIHKTGMRTTLNCMIHSRSIYDHKQGAHIGERVWASLLNNTLNITDFSGLNVFFDEYFIAAFYAYNDKHQQARLIALKCKEMMQSNSKFAETMTPDRRAHLNNNFKHVGVTI